MDESEGRMIEVRCNGCSCALVFEKNKEEGLCHECASFRSWQNAPSAIIIRANLGQHPKVEEPADPKRSVLRVVMKDGRVFEGELYDRPRVCTRRRTWFDLAVNHIKHPEVPDVFLFEECESVVDLDAPEVNLLTAWTEAKP